MSTPRSLRRASLVLAATASVGAALAPVADAAPKLRLGFYDCMAYNYATGFLDYKGSVKLKAGKRYEHSFGREKRKMVDKTSGRYRVKGSRITFKGGAMAKTPGRIRPATGGNGDPFFNVMVDGRESGVSCYRVRNP